MNSSSNYISSSSSSLRKRPSEVVILDSDSDTDLTRKKQTTSNKPPQQTTNVKKGIFIDLAESDDDEAAERNESHHSSSVKRAKLLSYQLDESYLSYNLEEALFQTNDKKTKKFEALSKEAQQQCIRSLSRLFLFRGTRKEVITRTQCLDCLAKIDPDYKTHCDSILEKVQEALLSTTGYLVIDGASIKGCSTGSKTDYYLVNTLCNNRQLQKITNWTWFETGLGTTSSSNSGGALAGAAVTGLAFVIYHSIFNSPGYTIRFQDLLRNLRKVDTRFPESTVGMKASSGLSSQLSAAIPELEEDLWSLLQRLKKEHYLEITKDKQDSEDLGKTMISFGPRFHLEMGKKALLRSYFAVLNQPVDERAFQELEMEEEKEASEGE